jgi:hypothetical protein
MRAEVLETHVGGWAAGVAPGSLGFIFGADLLKRKMFLGSFRISGECGGKEGSGMSAAVSLELFGMTISSQQ